MIARSTSPNACRRRRRSVRCRIYKPQRFDHTLFWNRPLSYVHYCRRSSDTLPVGRTEFDSIRRNNNIIRLLFTSIFCLKLYEQQIFIVCDTSTMYKLQWRRLGLLLIRPHELNRIIGSVCQQSYPLKVQLFQNNVLFTEKNCFNRT